MTSKFAFAYIGPLDAGTMNRLHHRKLNCTLDKFKVAERKMMSTFKQNFENFRLPILGFGKLSSTNFGILDSSIADLSWKCSSN